jgi:hypothetical protein
LSGAAAGSAAGSAGGSALKLELGPADSKLIVFDKKKSGKGAGGTPGSGGIMGDGGPVGVGETEGGGGGERLKGWSVEWRHIDGTNTRTEMEELRDVKEIPGYVSFSGIIIYRKTITLESAKSLNLGKVYGVSELSVNGAVQGVQWYGKRVFPLGKGENRLEITVTATMGNYLKTLTQNPVAQYWTNQKNKDQPIQSMGMAGPVTIY